MQTCTTRVNLENIKCWTISNASTCKCGLRHSWETVQSICIHLPLNISRFPVSPGNFCFPAKVKTMNRYGGLRIEERRSEKISLLCSDWRSCGVPSLQGQRAARCTAACTAGYTFDFPPQYAPVSSMCTDHPRHFQQRFSRIFAEGHGTHFSIWFHFPIFLFWDYPFVSTGLIACAL